MFRDILVVVQDSPAGARALRRAIELTQAGRGRLTILTPVPRPPAWVTTPMTAAACEPLARELEQDAVRALAAARDAVPAEIPLTTILARRRPCEAVRDRVADHPHDLLVVGAGSAARRIERRTPIPVLVVPADQPAEQPAPTPYPVPGHSPPEVTAAPVAAVGHPHLRLPG